MRSLDNCAPKASLTRKSDEIEHVKSELDSLKKVPRFWRFVAWFWFGVPGLVKV